ncbi:MAG: penicillin-binding protein 1C [Bacteroidia bacterium]|nr:penicillin-binding protein 1C [Bacteroidia bacterium]
MYKRLSLTKRIIVKAGGVVGLIFFIFLLLSLIFPLPTPKTCSTTILAADSTLLCAYLTPDEKWRMATSLDKVSSELIEALIAKEDKWFFYHPGINPFSLLRALINNLSSGKRSSGASTLTMQLARMADPSPRTYLSKIKEMFRALQYEWKYSKREILEMYLSYLPYGGNVEGVTAASYIFFQRPPEKISLAQAVLLTVIPNRPNSLRLDRHPDAALAARNKWIQNFRRRKIFPSAALDAAENEPVVASRENIVPQTPHLCYELKRKYPGREEIISTLKPAIQHVSEQLLYNHVQRVKHLNVSNGAVIVVDNHSQKVIAYCGSADFNNAQALGQVNGVKAIRSPGSTLKPAAYGLGFDDGFITPATKLMDVPGNFQSFIPENYDLLFRGETTVHEALTHSLNIPPVRLVQDLGNDRFLDILEASGFETIRSRRQDLGLSTVLGGCGVTLEELTRFYASFANGGNLFRLKYLQEETGDTTGQVRLFSEGTAWLIAEILSDLERPDIPKTLVDDSKRPKVAWKTGTSYGKRDAWAIGFSPRFTVGVWMGNFDGTGAPELSGAYMAVPLLMDIFNAIDYNPHKKWFSQPVTISQRRVCAETGKIPGRFCRHFFMDYYLENTSSLQECNLHQELYVSSDEKVQYCPVCLPDSGYIKKIFPMYDPELVLWFASNNRSVEIPPPHFAGCEATFSGDGPKILSPSEDFEYYVEGGAEQEILLQAASDPTVRKHYWYVNDRFIIAAAPEEKVFFKPESRKLIITCMDDRGRKSQAEIGVRFY